MSITNKRDKRVSTASKKAVSKKAVRSVTKLYTAPKAFITSRLRPIGNSRGVILNNQLIEAAGLNAEADIMIQANDGIITIMQMKSSAVNADLSTWDKQFKSAIKKGAKPEGDLFEGLANDFDSKEW